MTACAVAVEGFSLRYRGAERRALDSVTFNVVEGEVLGIIGPTGAGKSTLLKVLAGAIPHFEQDPLCKGSVKVFGKEVRDCKDLNESAAQVGLVMQDPEVQLVNSVVRDELAWGMENRGVAVDRIHARIRDASDLFGIGPLLDRVTHSLSGGEKQRVVLASIYCLSPKLMLLDEPTSELDPEGTEDVMEVVHDLAQSGVTTILVEHKVEQLAEQADRLLVLSEGRVAALAPTREVLVSNVVPDRPQVLDVALELLKVSDAPRESLPITIDEAVRAWRVPHMGAGVE